MKKIAKTNVSRNGEHFDYELTDGTLLHSSEWNGEVYATGRGQSEATFFPVYRYQVDNIDLFALEENSVEWDAAVEIVGFEQ